MSDSPVGDPRLRTDRQGNIWLRGRLSGHTLRAGGEPYLARDCTRGRCSTNVGGTVHQENAAATWLGGKGHGLCSCGTMSEHLRSYYKRRRWHRSHKARVLLGQPEPTGQPTPVDPRAVA